jgi:serpin B
MRRWTLSLMLVVLGLAGMVLGTACSEEGAAFSLVQADVSRNEEPSVATSELSPLVEGNTAFATDLYGLLSQQSEGNLFFSPYSISVALAMTYAGASGETASEMAETMHFDLPSDELHLAFNRLDLELEARSEVETEDDEGEPFELSIANSIWAEKRYEFLGPFLQTLALNYGAGARLVDYINDSEGARAAINAWVSDETNERIPELIPQGAIDAMTRLVLTNAIYFKASWAEPFPAEGTEDGDFSLLSGTTVTAPMMHTLGTETLQYAEGDDFQAIEMPYTGDEMTMLVILPEEGGFADFEASFDAEALDEIVASLASQAVTVTLPKFEFSSDVPLKQALSALGMTTAFEPGMADLSGMDGTRNLYISDVLHKAFVAVDEEGTEAAAATAVIVGVTSAPLEPKEFVADRPFLFLIRDRVTGAVLFIGRVVDPTR